MSRAIFLSSGGDVFLGSFVYKLFKERFYDEVDRFWICFNNHAGVPKEAVSEFLSSVSKDPKVEIIFHQHGIGNGMPITEMTLLSKEDHVMLLEDDGFIFNLGIVNKCFQKIESDLADVVGSPRFSCGDEIGEASKKKYNLDYSGYGDVGPNMWPNFFFCKRKDLLKTDLNFASKSFTPGEYSKELDHTFKTVNHGDTFVWGCIQLRAMGLRFHSIPQHHADPFEIENKAKNEMNWHPSQQPFDWIHGGSLSSGWSGYLSGQIPDVSNDSAKQEMETRVAFWMIAREIAHESFNLDFGLKYWRGIELLVMGSQLNRDRIETKHKLYKDLMRI
jgi:hypothetical protein